MVLKIGGKFVAKTVETLVGNLVGNLGNVRGLLLAVKKADWKEGSMVVRWA